MGPHTNNFYCTLINHAFIFTCSVKDLINKTMLYIYTPGEKSLQISQKSLIRRRNKEWILPQYSDQFFGFHI